MIQSGQGVVVGVSGGPDSIALLHVLNALRKELSFWIVAAHLDHQLRIRSDADARFVREAADELGLRVEMTRVHVGELAAKHGVSVEEAGRRARYAFFEEVRVATGANTIATAHHRDDAIETFFLRILRGSSLTGLRGIPPVRGKVVRPLIDIPRMDILRFLEDQGIQYLVDSTNLGIEADRNFIRNRILPVVRTRFPNFTGPLVRTLELVADEEAFMDQQASELYSRVVSETEKGLEIDLPALSEAPQVLSSRVILAALYSLSGPETRWSRKHVDNILRIAMGENPSAHLDLPGGQNLRREYDRLILSRSASDELTPAFLISAPGPGTYPIPNTRHSIAFRVISRDKPLPMFLNSKGKALFAAEEVPFPLTIRSCLPGDRIKPWGIEGTRKVKDLLIDLKVPVRDRKKIALLVKGNRVLWIPGIRRSREAPVRPDTQRILEVRLL